LLVLSVALDLLKPDPERVHTYTGHASVLEFIEFNWEIQRLSAQAIRE
jgi:hypothetical protein